MKAVVGHSPYPKKLTVKVLCSDPATTYINDKKEKRDLMNTVIADSSKVVKCVVYDAKKKEGMAILHPPPADVKTVEEALASPTKTKVSVRGKIIQVCIQTVARKTPVFFFIT